MRYSKIPHSIRFDEQDIIDFRKYQKILFERRQQHITFSTFVRLSVSKNLLEKLYDL
jgi:hypothetical protein